MRSVELGAAIRPTLATALHGLAGEVQSDSGIAVIVDVAGDEIALDPELEEGLYRVAETIFAAAWGHGRCSLVRLELVFADHEIGLRVRDDGAGLAQRQGLRLGAGFHEMRRAVAAVGGRMRLGAGLPHGLRVEVWVRAGVP